MCCAFVSDDATINISSQSSVEAGSTKTITLTFQPVKNSMRTVEATTNVSIHVHVPQAEAFYCQHLYILSPAFLHNAKNLGLAINETWKNFSSKILHV